MKKEQNTQEPQTPTLPVGTVSGTVLLEWLENQRQIAMKLNAPIRGA